MSKKVRDVPSVSASEVGLPKSWPGLSVFQAALLPGHHAACLCQRGAFTQRPPDGGLSAGLSITHNDAGAHMLFWQRPGALSSVGGSSG